MAWRVTPNAESSSSCVWQGSSSSSASNSASSKVSKDGRQHRNHRLWRDGTNHGTLFNLDQHLRKIFGALNALQPLFSSKWKKKINTSRKWRLFSTKSDIFTQPKAYDAKTKSLMCQQGLFTICLSLLHDVLDRSKSTSTYCWSHLLTNSGNLVAHLIICYARG